MATMAWDEKLEISRAVNVVLYQLFHCSVMLKYIAIVCDYYNTAHWRGWTNERHEEKEVPGGLYKVWFYIYSN
jgi:hypothetical protein